ncbi:MAG: 16S rRNA methyltransferase [Thermoplasmatota archaeon]
MIENKDGKLHLILADSELELVPREYWSHPAVSNNARKKGKRSSQVLLDSSLHYTLFDDPAQRARRGRPDIVHQFLLLGLDSILNLQGRLSLKVHTRNDELIRISPETRLPKNYNRYSGLFEELFRTGAVPDQKKPLISLERGITLKEILGGVKKDIIDHGGSPRTLIMDPSGEEEDLRTVLKGMVRTDGSELICIIGGFSTGGFRSDVSAEEGRMISLPGGQLKVWTVVSELLVNFRNL